MSGNSSVSRAAWLGRGPRWAEEGLQGAHGSGQGVRLALTGLASEEQHGLCPEHTWPRPHQGRAPWSGPSRQGLRAPVMPSSCLSGNIVSSSSPEKRAGSGRARLSWKRDCWLAAWRSPRLETLLRTAVLPGQPIPQRALVSADGKISPLVRPGLGAPGMSCS